MGFFSAMGKMIKGEPLFSAQQQPQQQPNQQPVPSQAQSATPTPVGPKIVPRVVITRVECHDNGGRMRCEMTFHNQSQVVLDLDKLTFWGGIKDLGLKLNPGVAQEVVVYDGPALTAPGQPNCRLSYIDSTGDYFQIDHSMQFAPAPGGGYTITRIWPLQTQDI